NAVIRGNTFTGTAAAQTGIDLQNSDQAVVKNNTVTLVGTGLGTVALAAGNPAGAFARVQVLNNTLQTAMGRGLAARAGNDPTLQLLVQGNDFHGNAIGIDYLGAGGATLGSD